MENTKDIGKIAQNLTQLGEVLKDVDFSAFKVVDKINTKIAELNKEFNDFLQDHDFIKSYDLQDLDYDKLNSYSYGIEEKLYKEAFETAKKYNDYRSMEDVMDGIREISREYYSTRREIRLLEELLA